eukprot:jgi/Galph1/4734/GphlegSOOS_G3341.1
MEKGTLGSTIDGSSAEVKGAEVSHISLVETTCSKLETAKLSGSSWIDYFLKLEAYMINTGMLWTLLLFIVSMDIIGFLAGVFNIITANREGIITIPFLEKTLPVAKGAARVISINAALILLTGCKASITWLRSTFFRSLLPIDKLMPFLHIRLYFIIAFCAALHAVTQYVNYMTGSFPWVFGLWTYHFPDPTVQLLITGSLLVLLMTAMAVTAGPWIRRSVNRGYNIFWIVHIFGFVCVYPLLVIHGVLLGKPNTWKYILGPLVLYIADVFYRARAVRFKGLSVVCWMNPSREGVTELVMKRPFDYKAGQYVQIRVPAVSRWEYHPISIASGPYESDLRIFIKSSGDWSSAVYQLAEELQEETFAFTEDNTKEYARGFTIVNIRGPFGAPTEHVADFSKVVLIGTGIGATPFSSVIREYLHNSRPCKQSSSDVPSTAVDVMNHEDNMTVHNSDEPALVEYLLDMFLMRIPKLAFRGIVDPFLLFLRRSSISRAKRIKNEACNPKPDCIFAYLGFFHSLSLNFFVLWMMMIAASIRVAFALFSYHTQYSSAIWGLSISIPSILVFGLSLLIAIHSLGWRYLKTIIGILDTLTFVVGLVLLVCVIVCIASWGTPNTWTMEKVLSSLTFYCLIPIVGVRALLLVTNGCGGLKWEKGKKKNTAENGGNSQSGKVLHFIWINRTLHGFYWFLRDFENSVTQDAYVRVRFDIFVTGVTESEALPPSDNIIRYHIGRPQWETLFSDILQEDNFIGNRDPIGVFFCGAPAVGSIVKAAANQAAFEATKRNHLRGNRCFPKIIFHKEYF